MVSQGSRVISWWAWSVAGTLGSNGTKSGCRSVRSFWKTRGEAESKEVRFEARQREMSGRREKMESDEVDVCRLARSPGLGDSEAWRRSLTNKDSEDRRQKRSKRKKKTAGNK